VRLRENLYQNLYQQEVNKAGLLKGFEMDQAKITAGSAPHYQLKSRKLPDGSIVYGSYDPTTGKTTWEDTAYPSVAPGGGAGGKAQARYDKIAKNVQTAAGKRLKSLGKSLYGTKNIITGVLEGGAKKADRPTIIQSARSDVTATVEAMWRQAYPNKSNDWIVKQTITSLRAAGWRPLAQILENQYAAAKGGVAAHPVVTPGAGGQGGGGPSKEPQPKAPSYPQSENVSGAAKTRQKQHEEQAKKATAKARAKAAVVPNAVNEADSFTDRHKRDTAGPYKNDPVGTTARYLRGRYPTIPEEQIRGIAAAAVAKTRG